MRTFGVTWRASRVVYRQEGDSVVFYNAPLPSHNSEDRLDRMTDPYQPT